VSAEQLADERDAERFRELWESNDRDPASALPWRSLPIRVWALLHEGPKTLAEIAEELQIPPNSVSGAVGALRKRGQDIFCPCPWRERGQPRKYHLIPREPLKVVQSTRGLSLVPRSGKLKRNQVIIELK